MMPQLQYYTAQTVIDLRDEIRANLRWYYLQGDGRPPALETKRDVRQSRLIVPPLGGGLTTDVRRPSTTDAENALVVYESLKELTAHQAAMDRLWVYLCHEDCAEYVRKRWLRERPATDEDAIRRVYNHFFVVGNRGLIRDNGVSRLWWLGRIAREVEPANPGAFLEILLHRQDVRSALIERPSVSMNSRVLRAVHEVMKEHWQRDRTLFKREAFRAWMVGLNRREVSCC